MIINAIRFKTDAKTEPYIWRLNAGIGKYHNFACLIADTDVLNHVVAALKYGLVGKSDPTILEVAVQISDDAGNTWILQRGPGKARCLCNGTQVSLEEAEKSLHNSMLDFDIDTTHGNASELSKSKLAVDVFELFKDESSRLIAGHYPLQEDRSRYAAQQIYARISLLIDEVAKDLQNFGQFQKKNKDITSLVNFMTSLESLTTRYTEISNQKQTLVKEINESQLVDISTVKKLGDEIKVIVKISDLYTLVSDPTNAPNLIEEELLKIESELEDITSKNHIKNISLEHPEFLPNWTRILEALSEMQLSKSLLKAALEARKVTIEKLSPVVKQCWQVIDNSLGNDIKISSELDNCLATLRLKMAALEQVETRDGEALRRKSKATKDISLVSSLLDKLSDKFKDLTLPPADQSMVLEVRQTYRNNLETARMAAEAINSQIKELRSSSCFIQDDYEKILGSINDIHDRFKADHARTLKKWQEIAKEYDLPDDFEIKQLISLLFTYGNVSRLVEKKRKLKLVLQERKTNLVKLEKLVQDWREKTGSQKGSALNNSAILLSEANGIIRYRKEKEKKLEKLHETLEKSQAIREIKQHLECTLDKLEQEWKTTFSEAGGISTTRLDGLNRDLFYKLSRKIRNIEALLEVTFDNDHLAEEFLFESSTKGIPFKIYLWRQKDLDNTMRLKFLNLIEQLSETSEASDPGGIRLFLFADDNLGDMLTKMGIGQAKKLPLILSQKQQPLEAPIKPRAKETLLTPKAKAILDVLGGKRL